VLCRSALRTIDPKLRGWVQCVINTPYTNSSRLCVVKGLRLLTEGEDEVKGRRERQDGVDSETG
jgi:hypothetical protein